jgi:hypothetical protein
VEQLAQSLEAAAKQPGHGGLAAAQSRGDLGHGPVLQVMQLDRRALVLWQLLESPREAQEILVPHRLPARRRRRAFEKRLK